MYTFKFENVSQGCNGLCLKKLNGVKVWVIKK